MTENENQIEEINFKKEMIKEEINMSKGNNDLEHSIKEDNQNENIPQKKEEGNQQYIEQDEKEFNHKENDETHKEENDNKKEIIKFENNNENEENKKMQKEIENNEKKIENNNNNNDNLQDIKREDVTGIINENQEKNKEIKAQIKTEEEKEKMNYERKEKEKEENIKNEKIENNENKNKDVNTNNKQKEQFINKNNIDKHIKYGIKDVTKKDKLIKNSNEQIEGKEKKKNKHIKKEEIIKKEDKFKTIEQTNIIKKPKIIKSLNKPKTRNENNKKQKEEKRTVIKKVNPSESTGRSHYVFYYRANKSPDNSDIKTLDSMSYYNGKNRANYQFLCSFGPHIPENNPLKNNKLKESQRISLPIGIASTSNSYNTPKKQISLVSFRTEIRPTKKLNIFKPVPKTIIQATKIQTRIQQRKSEGYKLLNNTQKQTQLYYRNKNNNYNYYFNKCYNEPSSSYQNKDKPKLIYYIRCPHCSYPLNDATEVCNYYNNKNYNTSFGYENQNQRVDYNENKRTIKNEYKSKIILNGRNKNNDLDKKYDYSLNIEKSKYYSIGNSIQNSMRSSNKNSNLNESFNNHNYYQSFGTSKKPKNSDCKPKISLKKSYKK